MTYRAKLVYLETEKGDIIKTPSLPVRIERAFAMAVLGQTIGLPCAAVNARSSNIATVTPLLSDGVDEKETEDVNAVGGTTDAMPILEFAILS
jgi:hypothetical protein